MRIATSRRTASPVVCPARSSMRLKSSRSTSTTATRWGPSRPRRRGRVRGVFEDGPKSWRLPSRARPESRPSQAILRAMPAHLRLRRGSEAISPTAHYTGHVWTRNALSHSALGTLEGWALFGALEPAMRLNRAFGGATLESQLLARHRALDCLLERAIEEGGVSQVIEVACGMSPRGWRFADRDGDRLTSNQPGHACRHPTRPLSTASRRANHRAQHTPFGRATSVSPGARRRPLRHS